MKATKDRIIRELTETRQHILDLVATLAPEKRDVIFLGTWSVQDLLAHLAGWDFTNADSVKEIRRGKMPSCLTHWNPNWAAYNAKLVQKYKHANWGEMLDLIQLSHHDLIKFLAKISATDFEKDFAVRSPRGRTITIANFLQTEIDDERKHGQQIRHWVESNVRTEQTP
ncbi:MAG: ClbS/DfsB family four-helix bundle protein [Chloroflexi bacterium]|nr:ClbS/DfsB family four-helix bundle protein [Chloroflexota bacterium]